MIKIKYKLYSVINFEFTDSLLLRIHAKNKIENDFFLKFIEIESSYPYSR